MNSDLKPILELPPDLWQRDESLRRAAELIELGAGRVRAVSFDFFDTLVWRLVGKPVDAFREAGNRLKQKQALRPTISPDDYLTLRRLAELKTRERQALKDATWEDIHIRDIYRQLDAVVPDPAAGVEIELGVESDLCLLNPVMAGFIQHLRQRGLRVLIVSDIYLSAEHLRGILRTNQFDPAIFDSILTSCDAGVCKGTGNLFRHALKTLKLEASQLLHIGDNLGADVVGARKAGVRGCHYQQANSEITTILDREKFLLGGQAPSFSFNSLRQLAARNFAGPSDEEFFGRSGALLLGPLLTRYATWACEQFAAAGVRKVGAFMREGEILGRLLQNEADAMGHPLEITPLYVNRKSTELAAIDKLSAESIIVWLERRQTLSVKTILEHFGLFPADVENSPFSPDEKINTHERILKLAKFLFIPKIAGHIEARSAEERRKVLDYLRPWIESGVPVGLCDLGYNASAQTQLKRILDIEGHAARFIGCYLVTCERAASRVLDGLDIRHFLGAFGQPDFHHSAFLRSPAFIEQCLVAPSGTTLGYERAADDVVKPVLDEMRFPPELLRSQRGFKDGVLFFQKLWLCFRAQKPELLGGSSENSRRILAELDRSCATILARATAFPLPVEQLHFGSLPLDDYYFAEGVKTICGPQERELARTSGYAKLLTRQGVLWPQAVFHMESPRAASDFFSCGKAMLLCHSSGDGDGLSPELSVIIRAGKNVAQLRECLARLKATTNRDLLCEILILVPKEDESVYAIAQEFASKATCLRILAQAPRQNTVQQLNLAADGAAAPLLLFLDDGILLPAGWDTPWLDAITDSANIGMVFPPWRSQAGDDNQTLSNPNCAVRCFLTRRAAFIEALGFKEDLSPGGAVLNLALNLREIQWQVISGRSLLTEIKPTEAGSAISVEDRKHLAKRCPDPAGFVISLFENSASAKPEKSRDIVVDWVGSFLDHGSLSHVNREFARALKSLPGIQLNCVTNGATVATGFENLAREISTAATPEAAVTVRHAWPPDWRRPQNGKLVVIQPWEFGSLPEQWLKDSASVDEFWVPSEYVRRVFVESGVSADKVKVVPNGVDLEKFQPQARPMKLATQKKFKFLFVGGTIFRKGPDLLLKAYLENFTAADDVCLVIKDFGGKTVYAGQTVESKIHAAQAQPAAPEILYLNEELPPDSLPGLYAACDCLVLPYRGEGFGLPALEAMACGLPVIVTAGGATDDFVRDEFAWRIPAERWIFGHEVSGLKLADAGWLLKPDASALRRFLCEAFADPAEARRRGQLAARHARQFWSWQNAATIAAQRLRELGRSDLPVSPDTRQRVATAETVPVVKIKITLPPCAVAGHLAEARELVRQKKFRAAGESALSALAKRPFHPEAFLLLAEIAQSVGDGQTAKLYAEQARHRAPGWKPARKFLNQRLKGGARPEWLKLPDAVQGSKPEVQSLSVCMIVKNEERFLGQCLKSIREIASQIVVVDTGSTDRTIEIAKAFGAEIHSFAWCDDFSAARNAALEHATGDWVLMLDADEELSADGLEKLKRAMNDSAVMAWRLPIVDVGREADGCSHVPRFYRNAPGLFYIGRVHEQVFSSLEVRRGEWGLENRIGDAMLIHHGYTVEVTRDRNKIERNLGMLERAVQELPDEPHLLMNLGLELARSGREAEALGRYREAFDSLSSKPAAEIVPELRETLLMQLSARLAAAKRFDEVVRVLNSPLAGMHGGLTASLHFSLGLAQLELRQFIEAADQMRQCLAKRLQRSLAPINREINTAAPHHCLALCLVKSGEAAAAEKAFQDGLKETGHGDALRLEYARFLAGQNRPVDALHRLNEVVAGNALHAEAWQLGGQIALGRPEFLEFARDWTGEAIRQLPDDSIIFAQRAEALLLSQETTAALPLWNRAVNGERPPRAVAAQILCATLTSQTIEGLCDQAEEAAVSRAFVDWYRCLVAAGARDAIVSLNSRVETLRPVLPSAAGILDGVNAETRKNTTAVADVS